MKLILPGLFLSAVLSVGCGIPIAGVGYTRDVPRIWGQDTAEKIVWDQEFSAAGWLTPPPLVWHQGSRCGGEDKFWADGECVLGIYWSYDDHAEVQWRGSFHESSYAHELCHAFWKYTHDGDDDGDHTSPCFSTTVRYNGTEAEGSLVWKANQALDAYGL